MFSRQAQGRHKKGRRIGNETTCLHKRYSAGAGRQLLLYGQSHACNAADYRIYGKYRLIGGSDGNCGRNDESSVPWSGRPLAGNLADRMSKYRVSLIGALLMAAACAGYIMAPNAAVVVVSRIINGVGFACCSVCMAIWCPIAAKRQDWLGMGSMEL